MYISRTKKLEGQRNYITYVFINGLGYSFLAETIIYLLAIHFGAGNLTLGYISSAVYLTGVVIFFVPRLFPNVKIITLFFFAWMIRGLICGFYGFTPYMSADKAVILIVLIYTVYCLLRNIAYPLNPVIQGIITKTSERGEYSSRVIIFLYTSMMLSRFISFGVLSLPGLDELTGILILLGAGILLNTASSFAIKRVPVEDRIKKQNLAESLRTFAHYMKTPQHLLFILLYCGGMSLIVLFNFSTPFLRKTLNVPSNLIFIFMTMNYLGVIISSRLVRPFLDRFGSKPMITIVNLVIIVLSVLWFLGDSFLSLWIYFLMGFISMFFIGMIRLLLDRLVINTIPANDRVGFSSAISVVFSFVSLGVGLAGGALADLTPRLPFSVPHEYSLSFGLMGVLALVNFCLSLYLKEGGSLTANELLTVISNPKNLRTIHNIDMLKRVSDDAKKESILIELEFDQSHLATQEIRRRMRKPTLRDKEMVLRSLFSCPRPELEDDLIEEAMDAHSWWRQSAIFALGAYKTEKSQNALRKIMREKYPYLCSVAAKSLARIGDFSIRDKIEEFLLRDSLDVRSRINFIIALSLIEKNGRYWDAIFRLASPQESYRFVQSLMIIGCRRQSFQPPIEDFFYELNLSEQGGFDALLDELADIQMSEEEFNLLQEDMNGRNYPALWSWCRNRCKNMSLLEPYEPLRANIVSVHKRNFTSSYVMAGLYLTLQLEKIHDTANSVSYKHEPE